MNNFNSALIAATFLTFCSYALADGQLMVMPARSSVEGKQTRTVQVSNLGDKPLYLKVDLMRVENPGINPEIKTAIGDIPVPQMITNISKLTLGPGQKREINLVSLKAPIQETVYRLYIVPVSSIKIIGQSDEEKISAPVTFGVGYGVVVHHLPLSSQQVRNFSHDCTSTGVRVQATGNVSIILRDLHSKPKSTMSTEEKIFPGTPRVFPVKELKGKFDGQDFNAICP